MVQVELLDIPFDPWTYLADWQGHRSQQSARSGATAVFVGVMRDFNEGDDVREMFLEHYPGMTERQLEQLATDAMQKWLLDDVLLVHRVGNISPSQPIVLVAVWSAHRAAAFDACRQIMEVLKHTAPFWKRETLTDGSVRWVENNTPG
ncbi:molybdenum cofactor biosynthesis protein MoaE [Candidatus Thiothrix sp. Deng01]|uniref:Molybdopterin synthase catalytic subunit n=1 Tax=Candidatus Thiothrix phosphatis TaxID=3112415 RepID=A0ABU6CUC0_9GAMM|nr:molybdenum cofactor biosynthesis protein MoaE [Candidatus Thiothrix sp. Deng01]MEB4590427.1 molybdenum cofactor biosynthesis protein MoaE [Candidatus Thiothrix sp. Deng01]